MTERRKFDHLQICLNEETQATQITTGFEDIHLIHRAVPEIGREEIDLSVKLFNHRFSAPIIIEGMTGGESKHSKKINAVLASAAEELGIGMGVGSQRAALENPKLIETYSIVREKAPSAFIIANIGATHLLNKDGVKDAERAIEMIGADALAIHLNPLQEAIQLEGETNFSGILNKIRELSERVVVPIIAKETGAGISSEDAVRLVEAGVSVIDVAGAGGTSWAAVEYHRARKVGDDLRCRMGEAFWNWGIPSAISLVEIAESVEASIIASGGIRSGIDAAKALALKADLVGMAFPLLKAAAEGNLIKFLSFFIEELRNAMFLVGAKKVHELRSVPVVITGKTREWLMERGFDTKKYSRRGK